MPPPCAEIVPELLTPPLKVEAKALMPLFCAEIVPELLMLPLKIELESA